MLSLRRAELDGLILDMDGTLYHAGAPIPGAAEAVARLRDAGLALRFVTNTFASSEATLLERLRSFGISLEAEELITPRASLRSVLAARPAVRPRYFLSGRLRRELDFLPPEAVGDAELLVIGDAEESWSYAAFQELLDVLVSGANFFATSRAATYTDKQGRLRLDTGALVALLEAASGRRAEFLGKPGALIGHAALESAGLSAGRCLVVGDDPAVDMGLARAIGAPSILVETGKGKTAPRDPEPDAAIPSLAELPGFLGLD